MSEHLWTQENITAHVMGGLEGGERERFEAHLAQCADCAGEHEAARSADRVLQELFAPVRPSPALEDRMIQALRQEPLRARWFGMPRSFKLTVAAAAAVLLAVGGAGLTSLMDEGRIAFPGVVDESRAQTINNLRQMGLAAHSANDVFKQTPPVFGARFREGGGWNVLADGGDLKSADALAKEARAHVEELLGVADKKKSKGVNGVLDSLGRVTQTMKVQGGWAADPMPVLAPFQTPPEETKADPGGGEGPGKPSQDGTKLFDKFEKAGREAETKLGEKDPNSPAMPAPPPVPGGGVPQTVSAPGVSGGKPVFRMTDDRAAKYFKPADAFAKSNAPKTGLSFDAGTKLTKEDEKLGERIQEESRREKDKVEAKPEPGTEAFGQKPVATEPKPAARKIIRSGDIEFEIDSFDNAVAVIIRLVKDAKGGFIATINSEKLPNGKVRGSVVVRVPPDYLDDLVLAFRKELGKAGELKSQRIGSQDITKQYTDLESRLKAARTMEERLLKIISEGKGQMKDLLLAEKELGVWRTKVEELEGELRYYSNLVSLSTLNVILTEKEIRTAALVKESERVNAGIEVDDVDKALREALQAITEHKGRVTRSELKQHGAGQFNALLHFETAPEQAGPLRDRLKQLGNMVRLEIDRLQQTEGGGTAPKDGKVKRGDTQFFVSLYNLANVAPRETVALRIGAVSVPNAYQKLREAIGKAKGRVVNAQLSEQDPRNVHALLEFDIRRTEEGAVQLALKDAGESITRQVSRVPEGENVTDAKILFRVELVNAANIPPRETVVLKVAATNVPAAYQALRTILTKVNGKVTNAQLNEQDRQNISANLDFHINRGDESTLQETMAKATEVISRHVARQPESAQVSDARVAYRIEIAPASRIPPRETVTLAIEVSNVQKVLDEFKKKVNELQGRTGPVQMALERTGRVTARAHFDVPFAQSASVAEDFKKAGHVRVHQIAHDQQAPEGNLAIARFDVTLSNEVLVPQDEGLWAQVRQGLSFSLRGLLLSVSFLIVGLLFVLPWVLVIYAGGVLIRRVWRPAPKAN